MKSVFLPIIRVAITALLCAGVVSASLAGVIPGATEHLVDAGDYRLHFEVIEGDGPVILLEAGGGMHSSAWADVAPLLAEATGATVVTCDRPGFGGSDLPDIPCDMREESQSTWRVLAELGLDENVILVGHSYGGWVIRLHANDHPDAVAGLVFVDPFNTDLVDSLGVEYCDRHPMMGRHPFDTSDPAKLTREQKALVRMVADGLGPKVELMRQTTIPDGIPVRVITTMIPFLPKESEQEIWRWSHEKLVAEVPGAVLIEAKQSSHMVQMSEPELIVETVVSVVEELRERK